MYQSLSFLENVILYAASQAKPNSLLANKLHQLIPAGSINFEIKGNITCNIKGLEEKDNTSLTFFCHILQKTLKLRVNYFIDLQKLWLVQIIQESTRI